MPPRNLLETRAALPDQGANILGTAAYFDAARGYAEALNAVHNTYQNGQNLDVAQQQRIQNARNELQGHVNQRTDDRLPQAIQDANIVRLANGGQPLNAAEIAQLRNELAMEDISLSLVSTAQAQANMAPVEVARRGNVVTRTLGRILGHRATRALLYTGAAVGLVAGALSGAWIPMAIAAGVGSVTSPVMRRVVGHFQGRGDAHAARDLRNTREVVQARNDALFQSIGTPLPGETAAAFRARVHNALYTTATAARQRNRQEMRDMAAQRRHRTFGQTLRDMGRGAVMAAGFAGLFHGVEHFAGGTDAAPAVTPDQAAAHEAELIRNALHSGDPNQLHAIPGLEHSDMHTLQQLAAQDGGRYAWDGMRHIYEHAGVDSSDAAINQGIHSGVGHIQSAHADGLGIDIDKVNLHNGHGHYYKVEVTDPNGLVVMRPITDAHGTLIGYDDIPVPHGHVQGVMQAELYDALNNGGQLVTTDQAVRMFGEIANVPAPGLDGGAGDILRDILTLAEPNIPVDIALGAAGGAVAGSATAAAERRREPNSIALAERDLIETMEDRIPDIENYLMQPQTGATVRSWPDANQLEFARMVHNMTTIPRATVANLLGMDQALIDLLDDEDNP